MRRHQFIAATLASTLAVGGAAASQSATIAYWRFEEGSANSAAVGANSILDASGNGLNGTPEQGPIYRAAVATSPIPLTGATNSRSLEFNGFNQRIFVPDGPAFQLTSSLTVEAWIKVRSFPAVDAGHGQILFRGDNRGGLDPYYLSIQPSGNLRFFIQDAAQAVAFVEAAIPSVNAWHHVAGTLNDATGQMTLYINGAAVATTITPVRPLAALDPAESPGVTIGGHPPSPTHHQFFDGLIDEVRISDRALDPNEFLSGGATPVLPATWGAVKSRSGVW